MSNPLLGPNGARVYAAHKGAMPEAVELLSQGLERLAAVAGAQGGASLAERAGPGAAGGLGFGLLFYARGDLVPGAAWVLDQAGFANRLIPAAVVTGEGMLDRTSLEGKLTGEVVRRAQAARVPVVVLAPRSGFALEDMVIETGGGLWDVEELARRAERGVLRVLRALGLPGR